MNPPSTSKLITRSERLLPWMLPVCLLFFRGLADLTVLFTALVFLYRSYSQHDWQWARQTWFRFSLLFWAYLLLVNAPFGIAPVESLLYALAFMRWPLFAAALGYWLLNNPEPQRRFLISLLCVSLFIFIDTGWQYLTGWDFFGIPKFAQDRLTGPFRNPVPGTLMLRVGFILLFAGLLFNSLKPATRSISFATGLLAMGILLIFITGERMPFALYCAGALVVIAGLLATFPDKRRLILTGLAALLLFFALTMQLLPATTERTIHSFFDTLEQFGQSHYGEIFAAAVQTWLQDPVFGSGLHNYREACLLVIPSENSCGLHPHNLYLQLAAETGIAGLALFLALLVSIILTALQPLVRNKNWYAAALSLSVLGVSFWPLMAAPSLFNNWIAALVWLGIGWVLAMAQTLGRPGA
jgi:O-antigen ligase